MNDPHDPYARQRRVLDHIFERARQSLAAWDRANPTAAADDRAIAVAEAKRDAFQSEPLPSYSYALDEWLDARRQLEKFAWEQIQIDRAIDPTNSNPPTRRP